MLVRSVVALTAFFLILAGLAINWSDGLVLLDQQRISQVALAAMAGTVSLARISIGARSLKAMPQTVRVGLASFFGFGLVSALYVPSLDWALLEWATLLLLVILSLTLATVRICGGPTTDYWLSVLIASVAAVVVLKVMVGYLAALFEGVRLDTPLLFEGTFSNRRFFGQLATLLIPLLAWLAVGASRLKPLWLLLLCIWWMLVFVSGTRGSWLALVLAYGVVWVVLGKRAWPYMRIQGLALLTGLLAYGLLFYAVPALIGMETAVENRVGQDFSSLSQREVIWGLALKYAWENPWLGIGPMQFAAYPNPVAAHPHNALLQLAAEWGIPAMLIAAGLVANGLVAFAKPLWRGSKPDMLRVALLISLLGAAVHSMVDGVIVIPYTQTWLAIVAGWALGVHFQGVPVSETPISPITAWGLRAVVLFALAGLLWGVWPEILNRPEATAAYLEHHDGLAPRFWAQGWIR